MRRAGGSTPERLGELHLQVVVCAGKALQGEVGIAQLELLVVLARPAKGDHKGLLACAGRPRLSACLLRLLRGRQR